MEKIKNIIKNYRQVKLLGKSKYNVNNLLRNKSITLLDKKIVSSNDKFYETDNRIRISHKPTKLGYSDYHLKKNIISLEPYRIKHSIDIDRKTFYQRNFINYKYFKKFYGINNKKIIKCLTKNYLNGIYSKNKRLLINCEKRLDIILVRLGYCLNLHESRKTIKQGYVLINNKIIKHINYKVKPLTTIKIIDSNHIFMNLYKYHLNNFPINIRKKQIKYNFNQHNVTINNNTFALPQTKVSHNLINIHKNKSLLIKNYTKNDIYLPHSFRI